MTTPVVAPVAAGSIDPVWILWSAVTAPTVPGQRPQGPDFTLTQKLALCDLMRQQVDRLSQLQPNIRRPRS